MSWKVDVSIVDIHRASGAPLTIEARAGGEAWRVLEGGAPAKLLDVGDQVDVGETVALAPGTELRLGSLHLAGGRRGRAHALVKHDAFAPSPSRGDVPRLLAQLARIEREIEPLDEDPLRLQQGPSTPFEQALSSELALLNLDLEVARQMPESVARVARAVLLVHFGGDCVRSFERADGSQAESDHGGDRSTRKSSSGDRRDDEYPFRAGVSLVSILKAWSWAQPVRSGLSIDSE